MSEREMLNVAESHSVDQVRSFLQRHPAKLNHLFGAWEWSLLGHAADQGDIDIVNYLLSMPTIDLRHGAGFGGGVASPLDLALEKKHSQCARALAQRGAPLRQHRQRELEAFLNQHPTESQPISTPPPARRNANYEVPRGKWIPQQVYDCMVRGTLLQIDASEVEKGFLWGALPCGWSSHGAWPTILDRAVAHEKARQGQQPLEAMKQERDNLFRRRQQLEAELADIQQRANELSSRIQQAQRSSHSHMRDFSSLLQFADRVVPIEQRLVRQLEDELCKRTPQLAALNDDSSSQPKLSLLLNCMGIDAGGINATCGLDLTEFARKSKRTSFFSSALAPHCSRNTVLDLLYCGELVRESKFPFANHADKCPVCRNRTAEELINFIRRRDIKLNDNVLRRKEINGRRILFCTQEDFPDQPADEVHAAVDTLQAIHEHCL